MENPYKQESKVHPELKDGHIRIANSIFRALIGAGLSGSEYQIVLFIIDRLWGWKNKDAKVVPIKIEEFQMRIGINYKNTKLVIKKLEKKRIIFVDRMEKVNKYGFNKYFDTWILGVAKDPQVRGRKRPPIGVIKDPQKGSLKTPKPASPPIIYKKKDKKKGKKKSNSTPTDFTIMFKKLHYRFEKFLNFDLSEEDSKNLIYGRNENDKKMIKKNVEIFNNKFWTDKITWWEILNLSLNEFQLRIDSGRIKNWTLGFIFAGLFGNPKNGTEPYLVIGVLEWGEEKLRSIFEIPDERTKDIQELQF